MCRFHSITSTGGHGWGGHSGSDKGSAARQVRVYDKAVGDEASETKTRRVAAIGRVYNEQVTVLELTARVSLPGQSVVTSNSTEFTSSHEGAFLKFILPVNTPAKPRC